MTTFVTNALFAIREFDRPDTAFYLRAAIPLAESAQVEEIQVILKLVEENHLFEAESRLIALLPPEEMGRAAYNSNCAPCHGDDGAGGLGPSLRNNKFVQSSSEEKLFELISSGRRGTAMEGFEGFLGNDEISNIIALIREWQNSEEGQPGG